MSDASGAPESSAAAPVAVFKKRGAKAKAHLRKRPATPPSADDSDGSEYSSSEDESGRRVKRRKKSAVVTASSRDNNPAADRDLAATVFAAERGRDLNSSNDATKQSNWHDEDPDLSSKRLLGSTRAMATKDDLPDGTYRGLANRASYIQKHPDAPKRTVGPVKAPTNIRTITITDMAPDVCTDYKKTGFCGFGDNCKFLHAREDYKHGWQLDKEWEEVTKGKKNLAGTVVASADRSQQVGDEDSDDMDNVEVIPFACILCQGPYKAPVVTRCGHYFCEACALKRYRKDPGCAACGAGTGGVFNTAKKLELLLQMRRERAAKRRQAAIEAGAEVSEEEEEEEEEG